MKTLSKRSILILYVLFGVVATVFFVYALFPAERAALSFQRFWENRVPGVGMTFRTLSLRFPATFRFDETVLRGGGPSMGSLRLDRLGISPDLTAFLRAVPALLFEGRAYGGTFSGRAAPAAGKTAEGPLSFSLSVSDVDMAVLRKTNLLGDRSIEGRLSGEMSFTGRPEHFTEGTGTARFRMENGKIGLVRAVAGLSGLSFDALEGACSLGDRTIQVEKITFSGAQVSGSFKGAVHLTRDLRRSRITLTGTLQVPPLNRNLSAVVGGTLETPTVRLK